MIRGYIAQTVDGYVADRDGGVGFLDPYQTPETAADYARFAAEIATVIMGRTTYDQIVGFGVGWPYVGKRAIVVTSRPLNPTALGTPECWSAGVGALAQHLRDAGDGDAWVVGGPQLQTAFLRGGHLDRLELFVMPALLGGGVRLFEADGPGLTLREARPLPGGIVRLDYGVAAGA